MPFTFKSAQKAVAAFLLIGVFLFIAVLILIGKGSDLFTIKDYYITEFDEGYGLASGSAIRYKSIVIGKVRDLKLTSEDVIRVTVWFNSEYRYLIKQDSVLKVQSSIIGTSYLILVPSIDPKSMPLLPGSLILSSDMPEGRRLMEKLAGLTPVKKDDLNAMAQKILGNIDRLEPVINSSMYNLKSITAEVRDILSNINSEDTSIGAILKDKKGLYNKIDSMMASLDSVLKSVKTATDRPEDLRSIVILLRENLVELKSTLSGVKNLVGGSKELETTIKAGERF